MRLVLTLAAGVLLALSVLSLQGVGWATVALAFWGMLTSLILMMKAPEENK